MPKKIILILSLFATLVFFIKPLHGFSTDFIQTEEVVVNFEKSLKHAAKEITVVYPGVKTELEGKFRRKLDFRPTILLIGNEKTFQEMSGSNFIAAYALPEKNMVVIDYSKMNAYPFTLRITLKHELCHLLLSRYISREKLPKWFNEGVSQWVSGGIAEIIIGEKEEALKQAVLSGRLIDIKDLAVKFPEDKDSISLAYQESKSIVEYIDREFGAGSILHILAFLENGDDMDTATQKSLLIFAEELEKRWHVYLDKRISWFTYIGDNLYTVLFFLAALLTIGGFIRFLIKKRAYKDEDIDDLYS
ncbi:MAG: hypothetical protein AABZ36_02140 [Nitrospirota bacterium]